MVMNEKSDVPLYFQKFNILDEIKFTEVGLKDSRQLTDEDREKIRHIIERSKSQKILITHGAWTAADTARYLKKRLNRRDQTIVITSASVPLLGMSMSDAPFNLGFALAKVQDLAADIYIVIKGKSFTISEFDKFVEAGKLYQLYGNGEK